MSDEGVPLMNNPPMRVPCSTEEETVRQAAGGRRRLHQVQQRRFQPQSELALVVLRQLYPIHKQIKAFSFNLCPVGGVRQPDG